jgi:RND family efflux transporter MFP subunit
MKPGGLIGMIKQIAILTILLLVVTPGCIRKKAAVTTVAPAIPVRVSPVTTGDLSEVYQTTGKVTANREATISAKIQGKVAQVPIKMGDFVTAGQTLIQLDQDELANQNRQAKATLAQAQARLKQAKNDFERLQKLHEEQAISQQEFDQTQTALDVAESEVQQTRANLAYNQDHLNATKITAPFNGYVGLLNVTQGEVVSPGSPLLTVSDLSQVFVTINLSDSYIGRVKKGQSIQLTFTAYPGEMFRGTVRQISPTADPATQTFPVKILLANTAQKLKAGMLAEVKFNFNQRHNVFQLPSEAIVDETGSKSVFIVQNSRSIRKKVILGITNGKMAEIRSGLTGKEQVVTLGQNNLEDGSKVVVK